jgi:glutamyl-tRNA reductase
LLEGCSSPDEDARRRDLEERLRAILAAQLALRRPGSPLGALREEVERIRQRELLRSLRLHPELPAEKLDAITRSLVNQIFHRPSLRLRDSEDVDLAEAVAALFQPASREEARGRD